MALVRHLLGFLWVIGATKPLETRDTISATSAISREDALLILRYRDEKDLDWNGTLRSRAHWMRDLPRNATSAPLQGLAIPGTHDTASVYLDRHSELSPGADDAVKKIFAWLCPIPNVICEEGKKFVYAWAKCQSLNLTQQLESGVRYFDLRVSARRGYSNLFFEHGLFTTFTVRQVLLEIRQWSRRNPSEVLILDFNHFYQIDAAGHLRFIRELVNIFGEKVLVKRRPPAKLTLQHLWDAGENILILYQTNIPDEFKPVLWDASFITSPWPKTAVLSEAMSFLDWNYKLGRDFSTLYVTQGVLTPDVDLILRHLFNNLRDTLGIPMTERMSSWLSTKHAGWNGLNIVFANFVETGSFIDDVIKLNNGFS